VIGLVQRALRLSGKVLARDGEGRHLLIRRSASSQGNPGKWDLPGGKVDEGESVWEALAREVAEECGIAIELEGLVGAAQSDAPDGRRIIYLVIDARALSADVLLSEEHDAFQWVSRAELPEIDVAPQFRVLLAGYARGQ
jgi:8-oxo-dGTP diphosphatase